MFIVLWVVLLGRAAMLQVFPDARLENLKRRQFETSLQIRTRRGAILDRNGNELAASVPSYSLFADPKLMKQPTALIKKLSKALDIPVGTLKKQLRDRDRRFVWLKRQMTEKQKNEVQSWDDISLGFIEEPKRVYPNGSLLSQTLGFIGSEGNGLEGLELQYDKYLQGQLKTVILPRDARGRPLLGDGRSLTEVPDGSDLELTIDHEVQFALERELRSTVDRFEAAAAVGIVLDAQTSEILAMANLPTIDPNEGARFNGEARRNRSVTDAFEPGSTMKTFLIASALKNQIVKPSSRYFCEGGKFKIGDKWISEAETYEKFQWLNVSEILAYSSNIGSAKIAMDVGPEKLFQTLCDFGFGSKTGIALPGEARGIINPLPWRPHLLANVSFGHGISATPLQVAAAYTSIANGGVLKRPVLVRAIRGVDRKSTKEFQAEEIRRVLSPQEAATLRLMLMAATEEKATGVNARIPGFYVAGKTGTAQKVDLVKGGYSKTYISSFAGFVPANEPRYVIYIAVDNPKKAYYGSQVAAPVFSKVAQYLVRRAGLPPGMISERNMINPQAGTEKRRTQLQTQALNEIRKMAGGEPEKVLPNLLGLSLREALDRVRGQSAKVEIRGSGVVVRTIPSAGATIPAKITMILENPD